MQPPKTRIVKILNNWSCLTYNRTVVTKDIIYRLFEEARAFVHSLKLKNGDEWRSFCKGQMAEKGIRPVDISANPSRTYAKSGWKGMGDWLGTGTIATKDIVYRPFEEARAFVHSLELKNGDEWKRFCKGQMPEKGALPADISASPNKTYAIKGWKGMGDWLGTGAIANFNKCFRPFEEARAFVHSLELKSQIEWNKFCNGKLPEKGMRPSDIPANPNLTYRESGWKGVGDWLGTGTIASRDIVYRPFEEARAFVHSLKLKNENEWRSFCKGQIPQKGMRPLDIPTNPNKPYAKSGWKGMGDWLGTGTIAPRDIVYRPFEEARAFVHSLELKSTDEWNRFCKGQMPEKGMRPHDIPTTPAKSYAKMGWKGMGDWLGTGRTANSNKVFRPFEEARAFVHSLKLKNQDEWYKFCRGQLPKMGKKPNDIPSVPEKTYATKGWKNLGDWLGTGAIASREIVYRPFEEARAFVHSLKLKSMDEWHKFCRGQLPEKGLRPVDIPFKPERTYFDAGWMSYGDWLGTGRIASFNKTYRLFEEARAFVRSLQLKNQKEWQRFCKGQMPEKGTRPVDIPASPDRTYATKGWKGMGDWLGKE